MHSSLTAVVLCVCAQVASAQCAAEAPATRDARMGAEVILTSTAGSASPVATAARPGGELIKTAAAGTRDIPAATRDAKVLRGTSDSLQDDDEHPRRSGTAMLLAALAVMSGIALRRYGAGKQ